MIPTSRQFHYLQEQTVQMSLKVPRESNTSLGDQFTPGDFDVILSGGGTKAKRHPGNVHFRSTIKKIAPRYRLAQGKLSKSLIVSEIIETIKEKSSNVGFVESVGMQWFRVDDLKTRERVSQALRNELDGHYRSSSSSRKRRRDTRSLQEFQFVIESNPFISQRMRMLTVSIQSNDLSDVQLEQIMTQTSREILEHLKTDGALLQIAVQLTKPRR